MLVEQRDDGIFYVNFPDMSEKSVHLFIKEYNKAIAPYDFVKTIFDVSNMSEDSTIAQQRFAAKEIKAAIRPFNDRDKAALITSMNPFLKITIKSILILTGFTHIKFFSNFDDALAYLKNN